MALAGGPLPAPWAPLALASGRPGSGGGGAVRARRGGTRFGTRPGLTLFYFGQVWNDKIFEGRAAVRAQVGPFPSPSISPCALPSCSVTLEGRGVSN